MKKIEIKCTGTTSLSLDDINLFQGKLKTLSKDNMNRLQLSITSRGFIAPLFIWDQEGAYKLLDGHQRVSVLNKMKTDGYNIPELPVVFVEADSEQDAREKLLAISSQYGEFDLDELNSWIEDFDKETAESFRLVDEEIDLDDPDFEPVGEDEQGRLDQLEPKICTCPHCGKEFDLNVC